MDSLKVAPVTAPANTAPPSTLGKTELLGRAMTDPDFRQRLFNDPEGTIAADGYVIDDETLTQLKALDPQAAEQAAAALGDEFKNREAAC
ncbi:MAG: Franean1_4349 family RiPP [Alphaproteobacteria bacterium]|nr:Franean1_4349 family RiPP [Alphaproteobacteria bacterium]